MGTLSSLKAKATVFRPHCLMSLNLPLSHVQGTLNTVPILTLTARRLRGSQLSGVNNTPSTPKAAADRNIAPMLVVSQTPSITASRRASRQISSTEGKTGRSKAQRTPRVRV